MTQISINLGILCSQVLGIFFGRLLCSIFRLLALLTIIIATEHAGQWRYILLAGGIIGFVQAVGLLFLPESLVSLIACGNFEQARRELIEIRGTPNVDDELAAYRSQIAEHSVGTYNTTPTGENEALLEAGPAPGPEVRKIGLLEFVTRREYRARFAVVAGVMLAQQLTGINAVVFYGVSILHDILPDSAKYLNAVISGINLLVTSGPSFMFDRVSHKALLLTSMLTMGAFSAILALSILSGLATLSATATLLFAVAFSLGLGPLPWMVASCRIEPNAVGAAQAIALTANWLGTFLVSFAVPVIAQAARIPSVFFVFAILSIAFFVWGFLCSVFPTVPGVPGRVGEDGRAWRPHFIKTAVLGVDARALESYYKWHLPAVICRARPLPTGPDRHLPSLAETWNIPHL
ncbi:general substrate transporter [Tuber brumale]|nr:general substrate transporter [Tuber brumale]